MLNLNNFEINIKSPLSKSIKTRMSFTVRAASQVRDQGVKNIQDNFPGYEEFQTMKIY